MEVTKSSLHSLGLTSKLHIWLYYNFSRIRTLFACIIQCGQATAPPLKLIEKVKKQFKIFVIVSTVQI